MYLCILKYYGTEVSPYESERRYVLMSIAYNFWVSIKSTLTLKRKGFIKSSQRYSTKKLKRKGFIKKIDITTLYSYIYHQVTYLSSLWSHPSQRTFSIALSLSQGFESEDSAQKLYAIGHGSFIIPTLWLQWGQLVLY